MDSACVSLLLESNGLVLPQGQVDALLEYERLLREWNEKINLVSRRVSGDLFLRHIVGSVSFLFRHPLLPDSTLLDVGTGGGLPGIPLAIIYPGIRVLLVDSIQKKIKAVSQICSDLGLSNVRSTCNRVEDLDPGVVGRFDYVVARAVTSAVRLVAWCSPLLKSARPDGGARSGRAERAERDNARYVPHGSFIFLKGGDLTEEMAGLKKDFLMQHPAGSLAVHPLEVRIPEECGDARDDVLIGKKVIFVTP